MAKWFLLEVYLKYCASQATQKMNMTDAFVMKVPTFLALNKDVFAYSFTTPIDIKVNKQQELGNVTSSLRNKFQRVWLFSSLLYHEQALQLSSNHRFGVGHNRVSSSWKLSVLDDFQSRMWNSSWTAVL